ncbi:MAG: glycosyltransferase family 4 protein [Elusimicrobia bacterium]|nr:glycosyltransferase family 4 protein [Elusimicrobiota bacterium]
MTRKVMFFTHSFLIGGDDTVLMDIITGWPSREDRLLMVINSAHPGRDLYASRLGSRAELHILDEKSITERKRGLSRVLTGLQQLARPFRFLPSVRRCARFIRDRKPDAFLLSSGGYPLSDLGWRFLLAARICRVPRIVLLIHNYPAHQGSFLKLRLLRLFGLLAPRLCGKTVTVSKDCAAALAEYAKTKDIQCIHNGISADGGSRPRVDKIKDLGVDGGPLIGAIGHLEERKGLRYLVQAMPRILREFPDAKAVIIGQDTDARYADGLYDIIREKGLEGRVRLLRGFLPDAAQYLECFDVCVIPSVYESFGLVALEAMRCRRPVAAAAVGGLKEIVVDGETGRLFAPRDPDALAEAVLDLLRSPEAASRMGAKGYERFAGYFTKERMAQEYRRLLCG